MLKLNYFALLSAITLPVIRAAIEDPRTLPLVACLSETDVNSHILLEGELEDGTALYIRDPTDQLTGECKDKGAKQQVDLGKVVVSAWRDSTASFVLHTFAGGAEALDTSTVSLDDKVLSQKV